MAPRQWIKALPCDTVAVQRAIKIHIQGGGAAESQLQPMSFWLGAGRRSRFGSTNSTGAGRDCLRELGATKVVVL